MLDRRSDGPGRVPDASAHDGATSNASPGVREWYRASRDAIARLERHAETDGDLGSAFPILRELCTAASDALNGERATSIGADVGYVNARPIAAWIMRRLGRRLG